MHIPRPATARRAARIEAPEPLHTALNRVLARDGWHGVTDGSAQPAEIVVRATDLDAITVHTGAGARQLCTVATLPPWPLRK